MLACYRAAVEDNKSCKAGGGKMTVFQMRPIITVDPATNSHIVQAAVTLWWVFDTFMV